MPLPAFVSLLALILVINNIGEAFQFQYLPPSQQHQQQPSSSSLYAISSSKAKPINAKAESAALIRTLQAECHTPSLLLSKVGSKLSPRTDADGRVSSLVLIRLAKLAVERSNVALYGDGGEDGATTRTRSNYLWDENDDPTKAIDILGGVCSTLANSVASSEADLDSGVEGIKAAGVLSRLLTLAHYDDDASAGTILAVSTIFMPLVQSYSNVPVDEMEDHHLSGLRWAFDTLSLCCNHHMAMQIICYYRRISMMPTDGSGCRFGYGPVYSIASKG